MLKQCSQNGLPSRWKKAGFSNGLSQLCRVISPHRPHAEQIASTHRTREARPAVLAAERLDGLHAVADALLALGALGHAQAHVARLAVWVPAVDGEADVVVRERAVARERARGRARLRRRQERVAALGAEEVLLVVGALA